MTFPNSVSPTVASTGHSGFYRPAILSASIFSVAFFLKSYQSRWRPLNNFNGLKSYGALADVITRRNVKACIPYSPKHHSVPRIGGEVQKRCRRGLVQDCSYPPHISEFLLSFLKVFAGFANSVLFSNQGKKPRIFFLLLIQLQSC